MSVFDWKREPSAVNWSRAGVMDGHLHAHSQGRKFGAIGQVRPGTCEPITAWKSGVFHKNYNSIAAAARDLDIGYATIRSRLGCGSDNPTPGGYTFKYGVHPR